MGYRYNAKEEEFEIIELFGKPMLFTDVRIDKKSVPDGMYQYEVRYDDDNIGDPVQIARNVMANHLGTLITNRPIKLPPDGYLDIEPENYWDYTGESAGLNEFMRDNPPDRKKSRDDEGR